MIKIIFEIAEDLLSEKTNPEILITKTGAETLKAFIRMAGFCLLKSQIEQGKTEFVVTSDKLNDKSKELYDDKIGEICLLAAFSEMDNKKDEAEGE